MIRANKYAQPLFYGLFLLTCIITNGMQIIIIIIIGIRMLSKHQSKISWKNSGNSFLKPKSVTHISNRVTRPGTTK